MSSCLSLNSMPISFSALCIMSFVMRPGVGDGRGEGRGVGVGVCAIAFKGRFATVNPAAPAAGRSLTKVRRLIELRFDFFIESSLVDLISEYYCPALKQSRRDEMFIDHCALELRSSGGAKRQKNSREHFAPPELIKDRIDAIYKHCAPTQRRTSSS